MSVLNHTSIKWRLVIVNVIPIVAIAALTLYALNVFSSINRGVTSIYNDRVVPLEDLKIMSDVYAVQVVDAVNKANAGILSASEAQGQLRDAKTRIDELWDKFMATKLTPREKELVSEAQSLFGPANRAIDKAIRELGQVSGSAEGRLDGLDGPLYEVIDPITGKIGELVHHQLEEASRIRDQVGEQYQSTQLIYPLTAVVITLVVLAASFLIVRSITVPLDNMRRTVTQVAKNSDLSRRLDVVGKDEVAELSGAFNDMLQSLDGVIGRLGAASDEVASAAEELSSINEQALQNIQSQADQTDQVATAMNQMSAASADVARSASEAQSAARRARSLTEEGRATGEKGSESLQVLSSEIRRVAEKVQELETKSADIRRVVDVINEIADQTNLLALNAAIEAARAGDQGRGFAVVADEVRSLAQRTQESTEEIRGVIEDLVSESKEAAAVMQSGLEKVEDSKTLGEEVASALGEIEAAVEHITSMGEQIASASEQQSVAADQVNGNITAIVEMSEQTRSGAHQSAQASDNLARLASEQKDLAGRFRTSPST
ncbi:methyl-accepting chemotaxis protein [Marinobacteraceae bacterium S3BR75-40.1]